MKVLLCSLFLLLLAQSAIITSVEARDNNDPVRYGMDWCVVQTSGDDLRVRTVPEGPINGRLANGSRVNVTDRWSKITVNLKGKFITGWVASRFLNEGYVETDGDNLNVRSVPPNGAIVGKLPNNTLVRTLDVWAKITYKNGWVSDEFLGGCR